MTTNKRPVIGILECGRFSEEMTSRHGGYSKLYADMLNEPSFDYRSFSIHDEQYPEGIQSADAWVVSGSRHGAYEDHVWIPPLEAHLRAAYQAKQPIVGICFGHQILAQALGGTVVKYSGGWSMGNIDYELKGPFEGVSLDATSLLAFHQDQVTQMPPEGKVIGQTENCKIAAIQYNDHALSIQPHPEFHNAFVHDLLDERGHLFPDEVVQQARQTLIGELHNASTGRALANFILKALA